MDTVANMDLLLNSMIDELHANGEATLCGRTITFDEVVDQASVYGGLTEQLCELLFDPEETKPFGIYNAIRKALVEIIKETVEDSDWGMY